MNFDILTVNTAAAAAMLVYTSYLDVKKREVEDKVWIAFGMVAAILQAYEIAIGDVGWITLGVSVGLAALIGMGLFFFGFYGGADGKALIVVALFVPYFSPNVGLYTIAPLIVLTNGVLISMLLPLVILILNGTRLLRGQKIFEGFDEPLYRKLLACLLGYKQSGEPRAFQFSMEKAEVGVKRFDFSMMRDDFETKSGTWVTPGIPLLVFFTAGYFAMFLYGDLAIAIIGFFLKALVFH